jgi:hypothetical protein
VPDVRRHRPLRLNSSSEFLAAVETITGEPPPERGSAISDERRAHREVAGRGGRARSPPQGRREHLRELEKRTVHDIWERARWPRGYSVEQYLALRSLSFPKTAEGRSKRLKEMPCRNAMAKDEAVRD